MDEARREALQALKDAKVVLCSACLLGASVRYDGTDKRMDAVARALEGKEVVPICPEVSGGLPVPRPPADLAEGTGEQVLDGQAQVRTNVGADVTPAFLNGARLAVEAARRFGATAAVLKERSPSCGSRQVHLGGRLTEGMGVTAAALVRAGVAVVSEEDLLAANAGEHPGEEESK